MTTGILIAVIAPLAIIGLALLAAAHYRDAERISWLERTKSEIDTEGPGFVIYNNSNGEESELGGGASGGSFRRLRPAIDAAMRKTKSIQLFLAIVFALMTAGCTNLYPEKSEHREREHEFMELHMKHIGK